MSASPREFTTTDDDTINSMSIPQLEAALALNYDVFKAKEASAVGDAVCITSLATVKPIRAKLLSLKRNALGASKTAALPVADDANDGPATDDAESEPAAKVRKFGKAKPILEGSERLVSQEELQMILEKGQTAAACAAPRKPGTFQKKPKGFASSVPPAVPSKVKMVREGDVSAATVALRPTEFPSPMTSRAATSTSSSGSTASSLCQSTRAPPTP